MVWISWTKEIRGAGSPTGPGMMHQTITMCLWIAGAVQSQSQHYPPRAPPLCMGCWAWTTWVEVSPTLRWHIGRWQECTTPTSAHSTSARNAHKSFWRSNTRTRFCPTPRRRPTTTTLCCIPCSRRRWRWARDRVGNIPGDHGGLEGPMVHRMRGGFSGRFSSPDSANGMLIPHAVIPSRILLPHHLQPGALGCGVKHMRNKLLLYYQVHCKLITFQYPSVLVVQFWEALTCRNSMDCIRVATYIYMR